MATSSDESTLLSQVETIRLSANEHFKSAQYSEAAQRYRDAIDLCFTSANSDSGKGLSSSPALLDEFTKSASNLCTALHKQKLYDECVCEAKRALEVNPFIAKCHAFLGICLLDKAKDEKRENPDTTTTSHIAVWVEDAHRHLCRAVYILPATKAQLGAYIAECVAAMREVDREAALATSSCEVRVGACGTHGNGVFAVTSIPKRVAFASTTTPFSAAAYWETNGLGLCGQCAAPNLGIDPGTQCSTCQHVWYCSSQCAVFAQDRHARFECKPFLMLKEMSRRIAEREVDVPDDYEDLLSHLITTRAAYLLAKEEEETNSGTSSATTANGSVIRRLFSLESHAVEVTQSLIPIASLAQDLFPKDSLEQLATLIGIARCNALEVRDATGLGVGQALHVEGVTSYFNHSCEPNCALDHVNGTIVTIRSVAAGEELSISYIPQLYWPTSLRQEGLAGRYFFTCRCQRCTPTIKQHNTNSKLYQDPMEVLLTKTLPQCARPRANEYFHTVVQNICGGIRGRVVSDISTADVKELRDTIVLCQKELHQTHYLFQDLRNTLTFVYSVLGNVTGAVETALGELCMWEALIRGDLPVKKDKVRNSLICRSEIAESGSKGVSVESHLWEMLSEYASLYDVAISNSEQ